MSDNATKIKDVLRMMPYGFYALTSKHGDTVNAMVVNWVTQVSFEPRLLAVGLQKTSRSYELVTTEKVFALNLFHKENADAIKPYTKSTSKNPDKMRDAHYTPAPATGCPILEGASAYIECRVRQVIDIGGDHDIIIGEPLGADIYQAHDVANTLSLVIMGWSYAG